jgi:hypothetical protein
VRERVSVIIIRVDSFSLESPLLLSPLSNSQKPKRTLYVKSP